jgi:hypothetical protein
MTFPGKLTELTHRGWAGSAPSFVPAILWETTKIPGQVERKKHDAAGCRKKVVGADGFCAKQLPRARRGQPGKFKREVAADPAGCVRP